MPRKRSFDAEDAVRASMDVFWRHGYEGTSIDDLTEATGVKRQSLYNALGEKRDMFMKAPLMYDTEERRNALAGIEAETTGRGAIEALFTYLVAHCSKDQTRRGCFLVNTAVEAGHDQGIQDAVDDAMGHFESFFRRNLRRGQKEGGISPDVDVTATAAGLLGTYVGIRVMASASRSGKLIKNMAKHALQALDA